MIKISITENEENQRLDRFLKKYFKSASLSHLYKLIRKDIKINGKRSKAEAILKLGDELNIYITDEEAENLRKTKKLQHSKKQFHIAYEDAHILIAEKPFGLLVHGDRTEKKNTLANQVISYLIETGEYRPRLERTFAPSPVNRLDRNTTGLVIFGKDNRTLQTLNQMLREKECVKKYYLTIVCGELKNELHLMDKMIKDEIKNKVSVHKLEEGSDGRMIETIARPIQSANGYTLVEIELITGRTHQIRAHMQSAGYCVIGDEKYGNAKANRELKKRFGLSTQFLHAYKLYFAHAHEPISYLEGKMVTAPLTSYMESIKKNLFE
ncbi:RluA family pseudouridine synthase [Sinanaerobacter sp. ZZT-01]|uniref:RluA family pseudouridine synthase n=1 Tax=Sinanaerobacter sp. ZZT-01 TaxID=3111540 RepID=UPI002D7A07A3|nr:RluA family pseudouridine synthase [Sinanaerobacter sp. ZZT-01]WRR92138.1 RluA family pseudouridine synthase [Sinanaerobacter sp. ZZT-01]